MLKEKYKGSKRGPKEKRVKELALPTRVSNRQKINKRDDLVDPSSSEHDEIITSLAQMLTAFDMNYIQKTSLPSFAS